LNPVSLKAVLSINLFFFSPAIISNNPVLTLSFV
jgi:hypothetical protein